MPRSCSVSIRTLPAVLLAIAGTAHSAPGAVFPSGIGMWSLDGVAGFQIFGQNPFDKAGNALARLGDINGDGYDDLLIGAPDSGVSPSDRGETYVVFGAPGLGASGSLDLATLDGTNGFVINGVVSDDHSGYAVASGDINGDGTPDILIGANTANFPGRTYAGAVYVVFGGPGVGATGNLDLASLSGANGFVIRGIGQGDRAGHSVDLAGDVNGDTFDDIIIGAPSAKPGGGESSAGEAYIVFGGPGVGTSGFIELSTLSAQTGLAIRGIPDELTGTAFTGWSVSGAGDVNDDGTDDVIIGAPSANVFDVQNAGHAYIVFGAPTLGAAGPFECSSLNGANGFLVQGAVRNDHLGTNADGAKDINADGIDDIIIGADYRLTNGLYVGRTYIVFGAPDIGGSGPLHVFAISGSTGITIVGKSPGGSYSERACAFTDDIDGDFHPDVLIGAAWMSGAQEGDVRIGEAYAVFGGPGLVASGNMTLDFLNGVNGFTMVGSDSHDRCGIAVSGVGDLNADGIADIGVGAIGGDPENRIDAGEVYIVFGRAPVVCAGDIDTDGFTNVSDFNILATHFGTPVAPNTEGDLTGDGLVNVADFNILAGDFGCGT